MKILIPYIEIWINANPMDNFRLKYFHRGINFEKEYDYDYMQWKFMFKWRFSLWLGWKCFHLSNFWYLKIPKWLF